MKKLLFAVGLLLVSCGREIALTAGAPELLGSWTSRCYLAHDAGHQVDQWKFLDDSRAELVVEGRDGCNGEPVRVTAHYFGTYTAGTTAPKPVDFLVEYAEYTYHLEAESIEYANQHVLCGSKNWKLGVPTRCDFSHHPAATIYQIVEVKSGQLFVGQETNQFDKTAPDRRPEAIDYSVPFSP